MYRIMFVKSAKENYASLYQFETITTNGVVSPVEFNTLEELDTHVELLLNEGGYAKADFIIVEVKDYNVIADIAENIE